MTKQLVLIFSAALAALPFTSAADGNSDFSYTFVEAGYIQYNGTAVLGVSSRIADLGGPELRAGYQVTDTIAVMGGYQGLSDGAFELDTAYAGLFYIFRDLSNPLRDGVFDLYVGPTIERNDFSYTLSYDTVSPLTGEVIDTVEESYGDDDTAAGVRLGMRRMFDTGAEGNLELRYVTGDADYFGMSLTLIRPFADSLGGYFKVDSFDGSMGLGLGLRYNF